MSAQHSLISRLKHGRPEGKRRYLCFRQKPFSFHLYMALEITPSPRDTRNVVAQSVFRLKPGAVPLGFHALSLRKSIAVSMLRWRTLRGYFIGVCIRDRIGWHRSPRRRPSSRTSPENQASTGSSGPYLHQRQEQRMKLQFRLDEK